MLTFSEFSGSPYQTGRALGKFGAPYVHQFLTATPLWESAMQSRGTPRAQGLQQLVQQQHPYIWDELQGLARGLELPAEDVFLWNCRDDMAVTKPEISTTTMTLTEQGPHITHHVSGDPDMVAHCGIAELRIDTNPAFAAFIYPGSLPGQSLSVTAEGLVIVVNDVATSPTQHNDIPAALPRCILTRALLNAPDLSRAVEHLNESPRSASFHVCLAQRGASALLSVECHAMHVSVQAVTETTVHSNQFMHETMQEFNPPETPPPADPDRNPPLMAADIQVGTDIVQWDVYGHPDKPVRFRMQDSQHI